MRATTRSRAEAARVRGLVRDLRLREPELSVDDMSTRLGIPATRVRRLLRQAGVAFPHGVRAESEVPRGAIDAAKAEVRAGQPLVVEPLERRLEAAIPGAFFSHCRVMSWEVCVGRRLLAHGPTAREAIDRAVSLYGVRR